MAGPRTFAAILPAVTGKALGRRGLAFGSLLAEWPSIAGPRFAERTLPFRIVYPKGRRDEAVLHLRVSSSVALDVQHLAPQLVERINGFFGYRAVARLKLIHAVRAPSGHHAPRLRPLSAAETEAIDSATRTIPDSDLGTALGAFGRALIARRQAP